MSLAEELSAYFASWGDAVIVADRNDKRGIVLHEDLRKRAAKYGFYLPTFGARARFIARSNVQRRSEVVSTFFVITLAKGSIRADYRSPEQRSPA